MHTLLTDRLNQEVGTIRRASRFLCHAVLMAAVQILLRGIAVTFNAWISARIGAEGMGIITLVMSISGLAVTFAVSGIQLAAVQLTAQALAQNETDPSKCGSVRVRRVLRGCTLYSLLFGTVTAVILFFSAGFVGTQLLQDTRTVPSLRLFALSLPAIALSAALNGYFTGMRRIVKSAIVTVAEQFLKIFLSALLLLMFAPRGVEYACLSVIAGSVGAQLLSLLLSCILYFTERKQTSARIGHAFSAVFHTAFPTAVGAYARQGLLSAEHLAIPWGFKKSGNSAEEALASYGVLHGMVYPLIFFPSAILGAFASLLIPEFAEATERGESIRIRRMTERILRTALLFAIGTAGIFLAFSREIGLGIYPGTNAFRHLAAIAPLIPVMYLDTVVDSMLKGMGEQLYCMKVNIADALCCLVLVVLLLPRYGITGYYVVQYVCEILNAALSLNRLIAVTGVRPKVFRWIFRPLIAVIFATGIVRFLAASPSVLTISNAACIIAVTFLYLFLLAVLHILQQNIQCFRKSIDTCVHK